jgi:hypothetical protein
VEGVGSGVREGREREDARRVAVILLFLRENLKENYG